MSYPAVLAMVMAGGEGTRLYPLTAERSKPAVPFAGRWRIVDFVLSNMVNSDIHSIYLLVQYKSQSLIEHISRAWVLSNRVPRQFVSVVPPQMRDGPEWFLGTADAVFQNRNLILQHHPALVAVFGADHIYRMDVRQMIQFHLTRRAEVTVAALPVPLSEASRFGIIATADDARIAGFLEKPAQAPAIAGQPDMAYASMGNYLFDTDVLLAALDEARERGGNDFGRDVLPRLVGTRRVLAYDFAANAVPGVRSYEEAAYWRDVGTIDAYHAASMDTLGPEPRFNLFNPFWTINSSNYQGPVARVFDGRLRNVCVGAGSVVKGGRIRNSIIRREVLIEPDVEIDECVIMDYVTLRRGVRLRRVIVDRYNEIGAGERIGFDPALDRQRFHVSEGGIVVVPKGTHFSGPFHYQ